MERLRTQEAQSRRQHGFARLILILVVGFCTIFTCVIFGMLFFGDASQVEHASVILRNLGIALGGGGAFYAVYEFFKRLLAR